MDGPTGRLQNFLGSAITVSVHEITNEPHRRDPDFGANLADLAAGAVSPLPPVLVTRSPSGRLVLLGGEGRFNAAVKAGTARIKAYVIHDSMALMAWLKLDHKQGRGSRMTRSEVARFSAKAKAQLILNGREIGRLDELLSVLFDFNKEGLAETRQLITRLTVLPDGPERDAVLEDIDEVDAGTLKPSSAISRAVLRRHLAERREGAKPAAEQIKTLNRTIPPMRGFVQALRELGPISGEIPEDVRDRAEKELREARRELDRIVKSLVQAKGEKQS